MKFLTCKCGYQVVIGKMPSGGKHVVLLIPDFKPRLITYKEWCDEYSDCAYYLRKWLKK